MGVGAKTQLLVTRVICLASVYLSGDGGVLVPSLLALEGGKRGDPLVRRQASGQFRLLSYNGIVFQLQPSVLWRDWQRKHTGV